MVATDLTERRGARSSLGERAYQRLRADIVGCRLLPGQWITERALAADTGFGASPIREALTRLDHEGLVRTVPRKGYQVAPLTTKSVRDLLDLWEIVGPELMRRGVPRTTEAQQQRLADVLEQFGAGSRSTSGVEAASRLVVHLEDAFAVLAEAVDNTYLIDLVRRLSGDLMRLWVVVLADEPAAVLLESAAFWRRGLLDRDGEALAAAMTRYGAAFRARVDTALARRPSIAAAEIVPSRITS